MVKLESKFYEEVHELECKYAEMYAPILEKVRHSNWLLFISAVCIEMLLYY